LTKGVPRPHSLGKDGDGVPPALIEALAEDFSRDAAEGAISKLGIEARAALVRASTLRLPWEDYESETSLRRRRSALRLLADIHGIDVVLD
jgi:hypothetical protein